MNAVITGASRGIGKAVAELLALHGYDLYLCAKTEATLLQTMEEIRTRYPAVSVNGQAVDMGNRQQVQLFAEWVLGQTRSIDVLVNNAGTFVQGNVSDEPEGALEQLMAVNVYSAYHLTRAVLPAMKAERNGAIFNICSIASLRAYPGGGAYSISKYALLGFTRNLREELKNDGIKVTAVIPGAAFTDSWKSSGIREDRFMQAADIARMILAVTQLSPGAVVEDIVMRPQQGDI
ncbi:MAG TPA: SDR family oxidoreductase [Flavisolibacter sp.]|jgi:short-subunit dehydrogenase|nr:SDR family oxidoreductase [Flavisolibacter sp.]